MNFFRVRQLFGKKIEKSYTSAMDFITKLPQLFEKKPLVLLRFADGFELALDQTSEGKERFTVVKPHGVFDGLKAPTLCLAEMPNEASCKCFVGIVRSKAGVGTFDSRITVLKLQPLNLSSFKSIADKLSGQFQTTIKEKLATGSFALSMNPKLSVAIINVLAADAANKEAIEFAASNLSQLLEMPNIEWEQLEAVKTSMAAFRLTKSDSPQSVNVPDESDSTLVLLKAHALEDNVITKDASVVSGFSLIEKHVTGRATFLKEEEKLVVYTANKGPLESMLGVDLIYVNETVGNTVMVQYKMLEPYVNPVTVKGDWIFRSDNQLKQEISRMKLPSLATKFDDYRLHRDPFYFKFVKRKGDGESHQSFIISLDHLRQLLESPKSKGPKEGVRVSYESLGRAYLREYDFINLIRSGYIGTHKIESDALHPIIAEVAKGNRALVLAWQKRIKSKDD
ncbi:MAG TPA: hypothetical protein VHG71_03870 [Verrucomicrobiae bacterium]|nr:hypothetical protein [Verrucomicrobiae bacterium]